MCVKTRVWGKVREEVGCVFAASPAFQHSFFSSFLGGFAVLFEKLGLK